MIQLTHWIFDITKSALTCCEINRPIRFDHSFPFLKNRPHIPKDYNILFPIMTSDASTNAVVSKAKLTCNQWVNSSEIYCLSSYSTDYQFVSIRTTSFTYILYP